MASDAGTDIEIKYWTEGKIVVGVDECGRGALCGPVTVGAVVLAPWTSLDGVRDSKRLSAKKREALSDIIRTNAQKSALAERSAEVIDRDNILNATLSAMREAVLKAAEGLAAENVVVLVDGNHSVPGLPYEQKTVVKGDAVSQSIAAASIIAKVSRDARMIAMDKETEEKYGLASHKGYGSRKHYEMLGQHGPSKFHRQSFRLTGSWKRSTM